MIKTVEEAKELINQMILYRPQLDLMTNPREYEKNPLIKLKAFLETQEKEKRELKEFARQLAGREEYLEQFVENPFDTIKELKAELAKRKLLEVGKECFIIDFNKTIYSRIIGVDEDSTEENGEIYYKCKAPMGYLILSKKEIFATKSEAEASLRGE